MDDTTIDPAHRTGRRPGWLGHLLDDRGIRLAMGLAVVVAIPVAVLFYFQFRSIHDLASTSSVVLRQLSQETADAAAEDVESTLKRPHISVLLAIPQTRIDGMDRAWLDGVLRQGLQESSFVEAFYVWSAISEEYRDHLLVYNRDSLADASDELDRRFRDAPGVGAVILPRLRDLLVHKRAIVAFQAIIGGHRKYVQVQLRFPSATRDTISSFVAVVVDAEAMRTHHLPSMMKNRLATVQHLGGFPQLDLTLRDSKAQVIFSSAPGGASVFVDERSFPLVFFDRELLEYAAPFEAEPETWTLQTGFGNQTIEAIAESSSRPQLALMAILALVMAAGVFFVAGAAAREVRLAELKSNFVASVSHDLKTPLALIQLFAETLELGRVRTPERAAEYYRIINGEAKKLTRLIENILDFSRMEAGLRPYRTAPADLGEVTRDVVARLHSQFEQGRFTVTTRVDPGLPSVDIDTGAVQQAIENVLANAMKYAREHRDIDVHVARDARHVAVRVTDHGIGIPRHLQRRVFRKFFRVDSALGGGPQGTGLGLAIVDHTMRGHGGTVGVTSEPGRGSTFTLAFPIPAAMADAYKETDMKRILVIEDEPQMLLGLRDNLELEGYDVQTAADGEQGLLRAAAFNPDLVILDLMLPKKNGFDVCRELRERSAATSIVMLTARSAETDKVLGLELGADDYVTKPFSITELLARVRAVLRRTSTRPPTEDTVRIGDLEIDFKLHQARRDKRRVEFTAREFELLRYFVQHKGKVVTREQILNEVWGYEEFPTTRTIDNFVAKLRQKIERAPHEPEHILTIHGSGYKFVG